MASKKQAVGGGVNTTVSKKGKAGGPTSMDRKKFGRNMAKVKNQGG